MLSPICWNEQSPLSLGFSYHQAGQTLSLNQVLPVLMCHLLLIITSVLRLKLIQILLFLSFPLQLSIVVHAPLTSLFPTAFLQTPEQMFFLFRVSYWCQA